MTAPASPLAAQLRTLIEKWTGRRELLRSLASEPKRTREGREVLMYGVEAITECADDLDALLAERTERGETDVEPLTDEERAELDKALAAIVLVNFTPREREIAAVVARAALNRQASSLGARETCGWRTDFNVARTSTKPVLLIDADDDVQVAKYVDFGPGLSPLGYHSGWFDQATGYHELEPVAWMPLPPPPSSARSQEGT